jgi:hypothetical protein
MVVDVEEASSSAVSSRPRSKQGVPRVSLAVAEGYARGVWNAARAGDAVPVAVARAISGKDTTRASGGAWRQKVVALRVFHLVEKLTNDNLKLSLSGLGVVNQADVGKQRAARRDAVMSVESYAQILNNSDGHELPGANSIAGIFEYDYSLSAEDAKLATSAFLESVSHAELVGTSGVVHIDKSYAPPQVEQDEADTDVVGDPNVEVDPGEGEGSLHPTTEEVRVEPPAPLASGAGQSQTPTRGVVTDRPAVELNVTLDMSDWDVDDVTKVLQLLGFGEREAEK